MNFLSILKKPIVSEKSFQASTSGKFSFVVGANATKPQIAQAFTALYGASVTKVTTSILPKKTRVLGKRGRLMQRRETQKRAVISVSGDATSIDITQIKK